MKRTVTFQGNPLTLVGRNIEEGTVAPDFNVVDGELNPADLEGFKDKVKIITSFPSIDTPVCDLQVKEFNKRATELSEDIVVVGISKDLPFAQKRFCDMNGIDNVKVFSDYKTSSYGINYGLLIKELNLLARTVIILDKSNVIRYIQLVEEITESPDYDEVIRNVEEVLASPSSAPGSSAVQRCKPCEGGVLPLDASTVNKAMAEHAGWKIVEAKKISKEIKFKDFTEAKYFVDLLSIVAEEQGHHPDITIVWNKVQITLTTHAAGGLTDNDLIMAGIIDGLV